MIDARPGDFILTHRKGLVSAIIRAGQRWRGGSGANWSHVAYVATPDRIIEALTRGVAKGPVAKYETVDHLVVHTELSHVDAVQATSFAVSCLGQKYGFWTILGIALRFLTPGRGLWFGMNGTEICSGLVAQALCRGWANFPVNPASITPSELAAAYGIGPIVAQEADKPSKDGV